MSRKDKSETGEDPGPAPHVQFTDGVEHIPTDGVEHIPVDTTASAAQQERLP